MNHDRNMRRAIGLAKHNPEFPFGAVIVHRITDTIIAEGYNQSYISPTYHGEIVAINRCAAAHPQINWHELALYTTAEPCAMCQSAIEWAGIDTVYFGTSIPYLQQHGWPQIDIRAIQIAGLTPFGNCTVLGGILENDCNALFDSAQRGRTA